MAELPYAEASGKAWPRENTTKTNCGQDRHSKASAEGCAENSGPPPRAARSYPQSTLPKAISYLVFQTQQRKSQELEEADRVYLRQR